jgi:hypothetical protein
MTEQELRIAKLSKIMNSGQRIKTGGLAAQNEAYSRVISMLEKNLNDEKKFNLLQEKKKIMLEKAEREQGNLRDSINRHHFKVLLKQIDEKKQNKKIEINEAIQEKELIEETYKPNNYKMKEILDHQIEEKKRLKEEEKSRDAAMDNLRLEIAKKSLDFEMKNKSEGKQKLQESLRQSWEKTENINQLQKVIERVRRFGDTYVIDSENEDDLTETVKQNDSKNIETLKRYEKIMGKIKDTNKTRHQNNYPADDLSFTSKFSRKRSKSLISNFSTTTHKEAIEKLEKLKKEEEKIAKEKANLVGFLESRSHTKYSSRPITVSSILKNN